MSDLPAEELSYQAVVSEFFLGLRGSGLMLSPLDQELVADWERRGLPAPVVCRGIRHGLAALVESGPGPRRAPVRSLRALRHAVEDEWRAYQSGRVGDAPPPLPASDDALRRLEEARALLATGAGLAGSSEPVRAAHREAQRALLAADALDARPGTRAEQVDAALRAADAKLLAAWLAALPRAERAALGACVQRLAGARRPGESRRAHRNALRAHLRDLGGQAGITWLCGPGGSV